MINIQYISLSKDGEYTRMSVTWDEIDDSGKTIATNKRLSRVVANGDVLQHTNALYDIAKTVIEEEG